jgi:hypothetical protein
LQQPWIIDSLFYLEGKSDAEINLYKVFHRRIERMLTATSPIIAGLAKDSQVGRKPILESTADIAEHAITRYVRRCIIESPIYRCIGRVDRVVSRAGENAAEPAEGVGRQVNTRPEVIQGETQDDVSSEHTCRRSG